MAGQYGAWAYEWRARLVDLTYHSLLEPDAWDRWLAELAGAFPGGKGAMFFHDSVSSRGAVTLTSGFDPVATAAYDSYYNGVNPWMIGAKARPVGVGVRAERMLARNALLSTEYYADWLKPQALQTGIGLTVSRKSDRSFLISVVGDRPDDEQWDTGASLLTEISPHLQRVAAMHRQLADPTFAAGRVSQLLERVDAAMLTVGEGRQLTWLNEAAQIAVEQGDLVHISRGGKVVMSSSPADDILGRMLVPPWIDESAPRAAKFTTRTRLGRSFKIELTNLARSKLEHFLRGSSALIVFSASRVDMKTAPAELKRQYALTIRESLIAMNLAEGHSVSEMADQMGISRETIRTHLKSIFSKMGVSRQAEAVSRLLNLISAGG